MLVGTKYYSSTFFVRKIGGYLMENTEFESNEKKKVAGIYIRVSTEDQARGVP